MSSKDDITVAASAGSELDALWQLVNIGRGRDGWNDDVPLGSVLSPVLFEGRPAGAQAVRQPDHRRGPVRLQLRGKSLNFLHKYLLLFYLLEQSKHCNFSYTDVLELYRFEQTRQDFRVRTVII